MIRRLLAITAALAAGYALPALFLIGLKDFGVATAIAALCWLGVDILGDIETKRAAAYRRHRESVWERREQHS